MKNKKIYIVSLVLVVVALVIFLNYRSNNLEIIDNSNSNLQVSPINEVSEIKQDFQKETPINIKQAKVSLEVLDKKYEISVDENSTVFDAMEKLQRDDNTFSYKFTKHSGLGAFVTEINQVKGVPNKYWIYYVNGEKATIGISKYVLKQGDIISWKQE